MLLNKDEKLLFREQNVEFVSLKKSGTLHLSNQRLFLERIVIEKQLMGLKKREHETLLVDVSLGHIHDIIVDKNLLTKSHIVKVVTQQGTYSLKVHDPYHWQERITAARKEISGSPNNSMSQPTIIINAGPQGAQQAIQKETIERQVIKIRCRYCGTLVDEVIGTCPSCGAKL